MTEETNIKKHLSNPFLWVTLGGIIIAGVTAYNQIETNTVYIKTVEARLNKKIEILNRIEKRIVIIEKELISREKPINKVEAIEKEITAIKIELVKCQMQN